MAHQILLSTIILASGSPRRFELLRSLGLEVEAVASGYHEPDQPQMSPVALASHHTREKLRSFLESQAGQPLEVPALAADTVVDDNGKALGKPQDATEASRMLERLSGRDHFVHTAFAMAVPGIEAWTEEVATTRVRFYRLTPEEVDEYVATGEPFDKAGGYGIQGRAASLVEGIDGDFYTVMGLPLGRVVRALRRLGFVLPGPK